MIELPGLRGDDPLGFLAGVGLVALSEQDFLPRLRLAWNESTRIAMVEGAVDARAQLEEALTAAFKRVGEGDGVLPLADPELPPRKQGSGSDPMRMGMERMALRFADAGRRELTESDPWTGRWLLALAGQTVTREKGDVTLTPFYAPTGQMAMRPSLFELVAAGVESVGGPADALTRWRRTPAFKGANFDERAVRDAATSSKGEPSNLGAPSPTWLAVMGMRMFPIAERGAEARAVAWQRVRLLPGYSRRSLVWPLWSQPLDAPAVRVLLSSSALEVTAGGDHVQLREKHRLRGLGVFAVYGSSRRTLSQGDGPLGPAVPLWPLPEER